MLSKEQFTELRNKGLSTDQIVKFEKGEIPETPQPTVRPEKKLGFFQSLGRSIVSPFAKTALTAASIGKGVTQLGQAGISAIKGDKEKALAQVIKAGQPVKAFGFEPIKSTKEAIGVGTQIGFTALTGGLGKAATIAGKAAQFGTLSAGFGAGKALEEEKSAGEVIKQAFISGLTGAATGATVGIASKGFQTLTKGLPKRLFNNALKVSKQIEQKSKSPSEALINKGMFGSLGRIKSQAQQGINQANAKVNQLLQGAQSTLKSKQIVNEMVDELGKKFGAQFSRKQLQQTVNKLPIARLLGKKNITLQELNLLRQQLDRTLGDKFFLLSGQSAIKKEAMGIATKVLRNTVKKTLPSTRPIFQDFATFVQTNKLIDKAMAGVGSKFKIGLLDIGGAGVGGAIGGLPGAAVGVGARRVLESPVTQTTAAVLLNRLGKIPTDTAGKIGKIAVLNLIKELTNQSSSSK